MNILLAGGNGEVGNDISYLLSKKHKIIVSSRSQKNLKKKNIIFKKIDFSKNILIKQKIDLIINCIATHSYSKKKSFDDYYKSNVLAILNIIKFAEKRKIKVINLSTISIYDFKSNNNIIEDKEDIANNMLAVTKYAGEKFLELSKVSSLNLRMPGILTSNKNIQRPWLRFIINEIKNEKTINVFNLSKKFNSVIDTQEIYNFIIFVLRNKFVPGNYNFIANNPMKLKEILKILKNKMRSNSKFVSLGNKNTPLADNAKIKKNFKYKISSVKKIITRNLND